MSLCEYCFKETEDKIEDISVCKSCIELLKVPKFGRRLVYGHALSRVRNKFSSDEVKSILDKYMNQIDLMAEKAKKTS